MVVVLSTQIKYSLTELFKKLTKLDPIIVHEFSCRKQLNITSMFVIEIVCNKHMKRRLPERVSVCVCVCVCVVLCLYRHIVASTFSAFCSLSRG